MDPCVESFNAMPLEKRNRATFLALKAGKGPQIHDGLPINWAHLASESTGPESPGFDDGAPEGDESLNTIISDD